MEKSEQGKRGKGRQAIYRSHEEWEKAGRPDGWTFNHRTGKGRRLTAAERQKAAEAQKQAERRFRRDPKHLRAKLERLRAELGD